MSQPAASPPLAPPCRPPRHAAPAGQCVAGSPGRPYWRCPECNAFIDWVRQPRGDNSTGDGPRMVRGSDIGFGLTDQQARIVACAERPRRRSGRHGRIVRVNAAAGTGKTTTLKALAAKLSSLGNKIVYVTLNKSAVRDLDQSLGGKIDGLRIQTAHAEALRCWRNQVGEIFEASSQIDDFIKLVCRAQVEDLVSAVAIKERPLTEKRAFTFIGKTLLLFLQSTRNDGESGWNKTNPYHTYYPARQWHEGNHTSFERPAGLPALTGRRQGFYVDCARTVWLQLRVRKKCTFTSLMKSVQLANAQIDCDALLVDESQDLNECDIEWMYQQTLYGTDVFFVGDAAQAIYGFRGACPSALLRLEERRVEIIDLKLTTSFRFGLNIAAAANMVLFVKENGRPPNHPVWKPYRVEGGATEAGIVTSYSLLSNKAWNSKKPVTVLARSNVRLVVCAIDILKDCKNDPRTPNIFVYGAGSNSGKARWRAIFKEIEAFFDLFMGTKSTLDIGDWKGIPDLTWSQVKSEYFEENGGAYYVHVSIVDTYQESTMDKMNHFRRFALQDAVDAENADIILSTVHAAKGAEWDYVELCDDFHPLDQFEFFEDFNSSNGAVSNKRTTPDYYCRDLRARFDLAEDNGNVINLWYVALTRAKKVLSLPPKFSQFLGVVMECEALRNRIMMFSAVPVEFEGGAAAKRHRADDSSMHASNDTFAVSTELARALVGQGQEAAHVDLRQPHWLDRLLALCRGLCDPVLSDVALLAAADTPVPGIVMANELASTCSLNSPPLGSESP